MKNIKSKKENGRIYTPGYIVDSILNLSDYTGDKILKKHVIDNSCGDGAFLAKIVRRYCERAIAQKMPAEEIRRDLSLYIHGIEIDKSERDKCLSRVTETAASFGITGVNWDILCGDTLTIHQYDGKMDFVLGNPPYVRVHNLGTPLEDIKNFSFAKDGMTDLFIVFYEIGIRMLSQHGTLGYITPSSFYNSVAGTYMRKTFVDNYLLKKVVDLKHFQAFPATTYTTIIILQNNSDDNLVEYYNFDEKLLQPRYVDLLSPTDFYINNSFYFARKKDLSMLKKIFYNYGKCDIFVKNGYATLCDSVFIGDFDFKSKLIIPVVKSSKGKMQKIIYPYDENAQLISEEKLKTDVCVYKYLLSKKDVLIKRSHEKDAVKYWYAFGRSQAINDTTRTKLTINSLIRSEKDLKFVIAPEGVGVYGGLYIISDTIPFNEIIFSLKTPEFAAYIMLLSKYKNGGYYSFSSKDVKAYLDYKFSYDGGFSHLDKCTVPKVKKLKKKQRRLQRKISKKYLKNKKGKSYCKTSNIIKSEKELLKLNHRLTNIRHNYLHQTTSEIVSRKPKFIVLEDLNITGMMKNKHLAKAIQEQCFYEFYRQLQYKCNWNGIAFITADRWFPSSKLCSECGSIKSDLKLSDRIYVCECGNTLDRDYNASVNLKKYGEQLIA